MKTILETSKNIAELEHQITAIQEIRAKEIQQLQNQIEIQKNDLYILQNDLDLTKINEAQNIIFFESYRSGYNDRVIQEVTDELLNHKGKALFHYYVCSKDYSSFFNQYVGKTPYGRSPSHGSVVFSIGLQRKYRDAASEPFELSDLQIESILYYIDKVRKDKNLESKEK